MKPLPQPSYGHALVALSRDVFICVGGAGITQSNHYNTSIAYNTVTGEWTYRSEMPIKLYGTACAKAAFRGRDTVMCFFFDRQVLSFSILEKKY